MMREIRRAAACILAVIWALALLHCVADKATAHWHKSEGEQAHHHHHPLDGSNDSHEHDSNQEPVNGHTHGAADPECCHLQISIRSTSLEFKFVSQYALYFIDNIRFTALRLGAHDSSALDIRYHDSPYVPRIHAAFLEKLIAPNAPPYSPAV